MKNQLSRQLLVYPLIATMLVTQGSLAAGGLQSLFKKKEVISDSHPCAVQLKLEQSQIDIMENTARIINNDEGLRTSVNTGFAAAEGGDAVRSALNGDLFGAALSAVSAAIHGAQAIKRGSEAIKKGLTLQEMIQERKANVKMLIANPNICNAEVQKAYMKLYIAETQKRNENFIVILDAALKKAEGNIHVKMDIIAGSLGVAAAAAAYVIFKSKSTAIETKWLGGILTAGAFLGIGTGVIGGFTDLTHNIPTRNDLKAQLEQIISINKSLALELAKLN